MGPTKQERDLKGAAKQLGSQQAHFAKHSLRHSLKVGCGVQIDGYLPTTLQKLLYGASTKGKLPGLFGKMKPDQNSKLISWARHNTPQPILQANGTLHDHHLQALEEPGRESWETLLIPREYTALLVCLLFEGTLWVLLRGKLQGTPGSSFGDKSMWIFPQVLRIEFS